MLFSRQICFFVCVVFSVLISSTQAACATCSYSSGKAKISVYQGGRWVTATTDSSGVAQWQGTVDSETIIVKCFATSEKVNISVLSKSGGSCSNGPYEESSVYCCT